MGFYSNNMGRTNLLGAFYLSVSCVMGMDEGLKQALAEAEMTPLADTFFVADREGSKAFPNGEQLCCELWATSDISKTYNCQKHIAGLTIEQMSLKDGSSSKRSTIDSVKTIKNCPISSAGTAIVGATIAHYHEQHEAQLFALDVVPDGIENLSQFDNCHVRWAKTFQAYVSAGFRFDSEAYGENISNEMMSDLLTALKQSKQQNPKPFKTFLYKHYYNADGNRCKMVLGGERNSIFRWVDPELNVHSKAKLEELHKAGLPNVSELTKSGRMGKLDNRRILWHYDPSADKNRLLCWKGFKDSAWVHVNDFKEAHGAIVYSGKETTGNCVVQGGPPPPPRRRSRLLSME